MSLQEDLINRVLKIEEQAGLKIAFLPNNGDRLSVSLAKKNLQEKEINHNKKNCKPFLNTENPYSHKIQNLLLKSFRSDWEKWICFRKIQ